MALKQAHAQQPLKTRNAPSDRGLIHPKLARRTSNAPRARQQENVTQVIPIQVLHFCSLARQTCLFGCFFSDVGLGNALRRSVRPNGNLSEVMGKGLQGERAMSATL